MAGVRDTQTPWAEHGGGILVHGADAASCVRSDASAHHPIPPHTSTHELSPWRAARGNTEAGAAQGHVSHCHRSLLLSKGNHQALEPGEGWAVGSWRSGMAQEWAPKGHRHLPQQPTLAQVGLKALLFTIWIKYINEAMSLILSCCSLALGSGFLAEVILVVRIVSHALLVRLSYL